MRLIILLTDTTLDAGGRHATVAFRALVPNDQTAYYADPAAVSAVPDATAEEVQALRVGEYVETVEPLTCPVGYGVAQIGAALKARLAQYQGAIDSGAFWIRQGVYWDGTAWHQPGS